jgi:hypothetical protein
MAPLHNMTGLEKIGLIIHVVFGYGQTDVIVGNLLLYT